MKTGLWINVHLVLLITVSILCNCSALILPCRENAYSGKDSYLYRQLESVLLNNPDALYAIHTAFFESNKIPRKVAAIQFHLEISHMEPFDCNTVKCSTNQLPVANGLVKNDSELHEYSWDFKWSSSAVLSQINIGEFLAFNPVLTNILYDRASASSRRIAKVRLRIESLPCTVTTDDVFFTVTAFLTWVSHSILGSYTTCMAPLFSNYHSEYCESSLEPSRPKFFRLQ